MLKKILLLIVLVIALIAVVHWYPHTPASPGPTAATTADDTGVSPSDVSAIAAATNQFAFSAYGTLSANGGNIFFSPYSIESALAMVYEGAAGKTAEEIQSVFGFPTATTSRRAGFASLYNRFNAATTTTLRVANALWAQNGFDFLADYLATVKNFYGGAATNLDFKNDTEGARQTINSWVAQKTNDKIQDLFAQGVLNDMTRLVLTNAVYFKGTWAKTFDKSLTSVQEFHVDSVESVQAPFMQMTGEAAQFPYADTPDAQVLELPYAGDQLSMLIVLPTTQDLSALENSLSPAKLASWQAALSKQRVDVYLPKFTFDTKYTLNDALSAMGMPTAFDPNNADFSGMDGRQDLYLQAVIHQAFVAVDEQGTEAAAATGASVGLMAMPVNPAPIFRADHPFLFFIQDNHTRTILFMGRVVNPNS